MAGSDHKGQFMDEIRSVREEIFKRLDLDRAERRHDIAAIHDKIDKHYKDQIEKFMVLSNSVAVNGSSLKLYAGLIASVTSLVVAWAVTRFGGGG